MNATKHTCPALVGTGFAKGRCHKGAAYEHEGTFFCKTHHPPTVKAKADERNKQWRIEWDRRREVQKDAEATRAEQRRRADLFPEMLAALQHVEAVYRLNVVKDGEPSSTLANLQAVIAKATAIQAPGAAPAPQPQPAP